MQRSAGDAFADLEGRGLDSGRVTRLKRSLLDGASGATLARMASAALALGVALPGAAQAQTTVNPVQSTTYTLSSSSNPITFGSGTKLTGGVYGDNTTKWNITNQGSIAGNGGTGIQTDGIFLNGAGASGATVVNQAGGSITGTFSGIGSDAQLTLTNSGSISGGTAAGVGFGSGSLVNNLGGVISSVSGSGVDTAYSTIDNSGQISSTSGVGVRHR